MRMGETEDFKAMMEWLLERQDVPANGPGFGMSLINLADRLQKLSLEAPEGPVKKQLQHFYRCAYEIATYEAGAQKIVLNQLRAALGVK